MFLQKVELVVVGKIQNRCSTNWENNQFNALRKSHEAKFSSQGINHLPDYVHINSNIEYYVQK